MGLAEQMAGATAVKKIHINDIRSNDKNFYDLVEIEELAYSIKTYGQMENASVFYDTTPGDGKHYTLIGGHRRMNAIMQLYRDAEHDGFIDCKIISKPADDLNEEEIVVANNSQREKTLEERINEVKIGIKVYERDKSLGKVPAGTKKRDYIGKIIGLSGRQVQNILNKMDEQPTKTKQKNDSKSYYRGMSREIERIVDCKVDLTDRSIKFKCTSTEQLNEILERFGILEELKKLS